VIREWEAVEAEEEAVEGEEVLAVEVVQEGAVEVVGVVTVTVGVATVIAAAVVMVEAMEEVEAVDMELGAAMVVMEDQMATPVDTEEVQVAGEVKEEAVVGLDRDPMEMDMVKVQEVTLAAVTVLVTAEAQ